MTEQFIQERKYLKGVSPKTLLWYREAFKAFAGTLDSKASVNTRIAELRNRGVKPVSVNSWLRVLNAYFNWLHLEHGQERIRFPRLKEEQKILSTFTPEHVARLALFKPTNVTQSRIHTAALLMLDCGLRISEALGLRYEECDFDNLVVKVKGKGEKYRLVPFSSDVRKVLYRYAVKFSGQGRLMFGTRNNTQVTVRNFNRDFVQIGKALGITGVRISPHTLRHSFACEYLRRGGNLEFLRRILGHSSIITTQKYLRSLGVDDLQAVHDRLSPLSGERRR